MLSVSLLIRNGTLVTADASRLGDIRCREGRIAEIGADLDPAGSGEEVVDATGLLVFPGGVDPHVHMSLPVAGTVSSDDFESGTAAALAGGTTTIIDFVHAERGESFLEALTARKHEAEVAVCDYTFHMAVTWWGDETAAWMRQCVEKEGITSFKIYTAYKATVGLDDDDLVQVMRTIADLDALVIAHCEHAEMIENLRNRFASEGKTAPRFHALSRPSSLEGEATRRVSTLAGVAGARLYVVHVTCQEAAEAVRAAQEQGWNVHGETCPQYLLLEDSVYDKPDFEGAAYVIAPPIRPAGHQEILWQALVDGTLASVGTDHCPFNLVGQKDLGRDDFRLIPGGAAGIEHRLALLHTHGVLTGRFDIHRFVDLVSTHPAKLFDLYPRKGSLEIGADADLVLWDPTATQTISAKTHRHRCDRSIYEGFETVGTTRSAILSGERVWDSRGPRPNPRAGRFLSRNRG